MDTPVPRSISRAVVVAMLAILSIVEVGCGKGDACVERKCDVPEDDGAAVGEPRTDGHRALASMAPRLPPEDFVPDERPSVRSVVEQLIQSGDAAGLEVLGMAVQADEQLRRWLFECEKAFASRPWLGLVLKRVGRARASSLILAGWRPNGLEEAMKVLLDRSAAVRDRWDAAEAIKNHGLPEHIERLASLDDDFTFYTVAPTGNPFGLDCTIAGLTRRCIERIRARFPSPPLERSPLR